MKNLLPPASIHIVLVEPQNSLNIGSVARAMMNLGFSNLHLVAPAEYDPARAKITACWADGLVDEAKVHASLAGAVERCEDVVGFSARSGKNLPRTIELPEWAHEMRSRPARSTAVLFGREDSGLQREHAEQCRTLVRIPSSAEFPSFNLAQSVLLALYELSRAEGEIEAKGIEFPLWKEFAQLDRTIDNVLTSAEFYHSGTSAQLPGLVHSLIRRINPDEREMQILLGIFRRIELALAANRSSDAEAV